MTFLGFQDFPLTPLATQGLHALAAVSYGDYIAWWKVLLLLAVFLPWCRLLTWVDKDAPACQIARIPTNLAGLSGLVLALALFFFLPNFALALLAFVFVFLAEVGAYLVVRNNKVGLADLKQSLLSSFQPKGGKKEKAVEAAEGQVLVLDKSGRPVTAPEDDQPERIGYDVLQLTLAGPIAKGAERIELVPNGEQLTQRYYVDGYPYVGRSFGKQEASTAIAFLKAAIGMDVNDRRKPQKGKAKLQAAGGKHEAEVLTAGSTAGEQLVIELDIPKRYQLKLPEMGFSEGQLATLKASIEDPSGIVLVAAPKGQGLTSLLYALVRGHDAFISHIQTVERDSQIDLEGVTQNKLAPGAAPADELKQISWAVSQEQDVLMVSRLDEPRGATELIKLAEAGKRVYVGVRAGSTFDALKAWRNTVGDDRLALKQLRLIVAGRVVRKLCPACKMAYAPDPEALRKMNISPERVKQLYQARTQAIRDAKGNEVPCNFCNDLRFTGRLGVYEILEVNDQIRASILGGGSEEQMKVLFRKQKGRYLQEMALARVETGDTSIQEVLRVLRGEQPKPQPAGSGAAA